jgi:prepilin-type N-terminal cleavage/methylation domain-containing protein
MYRNRHEGKGFTIVEIVVVMAIIAIISLFVVSGFRNYARFQEYQQAVTTIRATIFEAKVQARSSEDGQARGVHFGTNTVTLFPGSTYVAGNSANRVTTLPQVRITTNLGNGSPQTVFSNLYGLPSLTGTVTIVGLQHNGTTTLTITASGVIE